MMGHVWRGLDGEMRGREGEREGGREEGRRESEAGSQFFNYTRLKYHFPLSSPSFSDSAPSSGVSSVLESFPEAKRVIDK